MFSYETCNFSYPSVVHSFMMPSASVETIKDNSFDDSKIDRSNMSYVVGRSNWEQLMASSIDFQQLLCWAKTLDGPSPVHVVEPDFKADSSVLWVSFIKNNTSPKMSDVFDLNSWYKQWPTRGGPLAIMDSRNEFLSVISTFEKNAILVQFAYGKFKQRLCTFSWDFTNLMAELKHYPLLNISRKVCINVNKAIISSELRDLILGDIPLQNTVIIINEWWGGGGGRVNVKGSCSAQMKYTYLQPSAMVMEDAKMYADKYLGGFGHYISVSARFEKVTWSYASTSQKQRRSKVAQAIDMIMTKVIELREREHVEKVSLAYDYGKFGSGTFRHNRFYTSQDLLVKFQQDLYSNEMTHDEYEESFMIFKQQHPAYIAMIQMTIAAKGKCLLQIGWGHCIDFTSYLFKSFHSPELLCIEKSIIIK